MTTDITYFMYITVLAAAIKNGGTDPAVICPCTFRSMNPARTKYVISVISKLKTEPWNWKYTECFQIVYFQI